VAKKSLIYNLFCSIYGICGGKGLVKNVIWGRGKGLAENVRIPSYDITVIWMVPILLQYCSNRYHCFVSGGLW